MDSIEEDALFMIFEFAVETGNDELLNGTFFNSFIPFLRDD